MIALLIALTLAAVWLLADITLTIRGDRPVVGVRSRRPVDTRTQLRARPFTARTEHLTARTECLLRRRGLLSWPATPAIGQTIPAEFLPARQPKELQAA